MPSVLKPYSPNSEQIGDTVEVLMIVITQTSITSTRDVTSAKLIFQDREVP